MKKDDPPENAELMQRVIAEVRMQRCTLLRFRSLRRWCSRQASDRDRPFASLRISLNPVRSSIVQDLRLLPIDSSLVYLAVSEYISLSLCVFSGQVRVSSHVNQQEHVKQQEAAKPCQIGKIVCFLHSKMLPFKKFPGLRPEPRWGAKRPPDPHLQSTSIHRWLRPCRGIVSYCWINPQTMQKDHSIARTIFQTTIEDADNTQVYW